jgi:hypothetical protein
LLIVSSLITVQMHDFVVVDLISGRRVDPLVIRIERSPLCGLRNLIAMKGRLLAREGLGQSIEAEMTCMSLSRPLIDLSFEKKRRCMGEWPDHGSQGSSPSLTCASIMSISGADLPTNPPVVLFRGPGCVSSSGHVQADSRCPGK